MTLIITIVLAVAFAGMLREQAKPAWGPKVATLLASIAAVLTFVPGWIVGGIFTVVTFVIARRAAIKRIMSEDWPGWAMTSTLQGSGAFGARFSLTRSPWRQAPVPMGSPWPRSDQRAGRRPHPN